MTQTFLITVFRKSATTPVTEKMWQDLMKKAISATASNMVLANKYKQMKNKIQQTQVVTSGTSTTTTSPAKTTQRQYSANLKTSTMSNIQMSVMKTMGTSVTQNLSKNQNWKGKGNKIGITNTPKLSLKIYFQIQKLSLRIITVYQKGKRQKWMRNISMSHTLMLRNNDQ